MKILSIVVLLLVLLPVAKAQRLLRSGSRIRYKTSSVYIGARGGAAMSCYYYTELDDETTGVPFAWNYGLTVECRLAEHLSMGFDVVNAVRKASLSFDTPYLINYTETAVTNISFAITERCLDFSVPFTVCLGRTDHWLDTQARPYLFIAPSVCLMYGGDLWWKRTHLIDNTVLTSDELPLSKASSSGYDYGIRSGIGVEIRQQTGPYHFVVKIDLSCYYGLHNTFSDLEKNNQLPVDHYLGLGDILHEQLGERHFRQVSLSGTVCFPFHKRLRGACYNFDKSRY